MRAALKFTTILAGAALSFAAFTTLQAADMAVPAGIAAAVSDAGRPEADKARDADRHPAESVAYAGIKPGDKVIDLIPGGGYFTRIFSKAVGEKGKVYALTPDEMLKMRATMADGVKKIAAEPGYGNIEVISSPINEVKAPEKVDVVWTSLNYHDMHNPMLGPANMAAYNKSVFNILKPGGIYIVIDHAAAKGSGARDTESLHRIDAEAVHDAIAAMEPKDGGGETLAETEMDQIRRVLAATGGNKSRAAAVLGIERKTLYRKLERMKL